MLCVPWQTWRSECLTFFVLNAEDEGMVMEEECAPTSGPVRTHMRFGDDGAVAVDTMPLTATSTAAPTMDTASTSVSVEVPMDRNVEMHLAKMGPYPPCTPHHA